MSSNAGNSQSARDFLAVAPFLGFVLFQVVFWAFLFFIFSTGKVKTEDQATLVLITSVINQGFSLGQFIVGYIYFRPTHERAPFRKDDLAQLEEARRA